MWLVPLSTYPQSEFTTFGSKNKTESSSSRTFCTIGVESNHFTHLLFCLLCTWPQPLRDRKGRDSHGKGSVASSDICSQHYKKPKEHVLSLTLARDQSARNLLQEAASLNTALHPAKCARRRTALSVRLGHLQRSVGPFGGHFQVSGRSPAILSRTKSRNSSIGCINPLEPKMHQSSRRETA